jgi:hypothetical protein
MGFFVKSLVDWSYIYKIWTYAIWTNKKNPPKFIFSPLAQEIFLAPWVHKAKIMI